MKYTVWAECKNCVHFPEDHLENKCVGLILIHNKGKLFFNKDAKCKCQKHIPLDNLNYLEWKYENTLF